MTKSYSETPTIRNIRRVIVELGRQHLTLQSHSCLRESYYNCVRRQDDHHQIILASGASSLDGEVELFELLKTFSFLHTERLSMKE